MNRKELVIQNQTGLHARPAKVLVNLAKQFKADIHLYHGEKKANAKSMVSVLTLGAGCGSLITIEANGDDEERALSEIELAFQSGLGDHEPLPVQKEPPVAAAVLPSNEGNPRQDNGKLKGTPAAPGIAIGPVFYEQKNLADLDSLLGSSEPKIPLDEAIRCARLDLQKLNQQMKERNLASEAAIFEAHIELLDDPDLDQAIQSKIDAGEKSSAAWKMSIEERATVIAALSDPLLAARAADLRDVGQRVLRLLLGLNGDHHPGPDQPSIVFAEELSPSETAAFDPERVLGFCITGGGPTSHIAILARAMGLPAIVGAEDSVLSLPAGTTVLLNGNEGLVTVDPDPETVRTATQEQQNWLARRRHAQDRASLPATTIDGHHIDVTANAGSVADAARAVQAGADGIGLLRTEFLFLERSTAPSEEEQFDVYHSIAQTIQNRPVIIRTLDIGGDKPLPYIHLKPEMNPFLGERGIRLCLNRPDLFRTQLRAILRAAPYGNLRIMFPMVSDVLELKQARSIIEEIRQELNSPPVQIGIMIEVPSAALLADQFAPEIDFFSIGTNDLTQYTLAIDRAHPALAAKHDGLHPAVLRLIKQTIDGAHQYGKRADLCGELGSDPAAIPILIGLGMDELSVSIPSIPIVKSMIRSLTMKNLGALAHQALFCATAEEVRELIKRSGIQQNEP